MKATHSNLLIGLTLAGLALLAGISGCATGPSSPASSLPASSQLPEGQVVASAAPMATPVVAMGSAPFAVPYYAPPERIDLCGEPVPLRDQDVRERFDKEFTLIVYNHAQVYLWLKRMERYFPWIEDRLKTHGLPDDLKYVVIVESDLLPNACSPKGAAGPWQFMPSTAAAYGLEQQGSCDARYDFERATDGAFRLLKDLYVRYKSWSLAIATYNCGDKRILEEMRAQKVNDYYSLKLPLETERYVIRILAIKAVLGNPAKYGYHLPPGQGYGPLNTDRVNVTLAGSMPIQTIADAAGTTFREFKRLNPSFRADSIPAGTHTLNLPAGCGRSFEKNFGALRSQPEALNTPAPEPARYTEPPKEAPRSIPAKATTAEAKPAAKPVEKFHTVQKGDTLSSIARKYNVSSQELMQANKLRDASVGVGQKIRIP